MALFSVFRDYALVKSCVKCNSSLNGGSAQGSFVGLNRTRLHKSREY